MRNTLSRRFAPVGLLLIAGLPSPACDAAELLAGAAKVDITADEAGPTSDRLYARAVVLRQGDITVAIVSVEAVAIGEIGPVGNDFLPHLRRRLEAEHDISPTNVLVNASHCHGVVRRDAAHRTVDAVSEAVAKLTPVQVGAGVGSEARVMENRRLRLKGGGEVDVRHAYSLPPDDEVVGVGPVDPEIGVLRVDRLDGSTLAIIYNFACHPIQGMPNGWNTPDMAGVSSRVIEDNLGGGAIAVFLQGAGGDINPIGYKDVHHVRDAEPLGMMLGLSTLAAIRGVRSIATGPLRVHSELLTLPRADLEKHIAEMKGEREALVASLAGTFLHLETFLQLASKHGLSEEFPSLSSYRYLHERKMERSGLERMDELNRAHMEAYVRNVRKMERISRINTNLPLLEKHQRNGYGSGVQSIEVELAGLRVGDFVLTTFPGELTVEIGLNIKAAAEHDLTFVAGYTNGYIYYAPTDEQLLNRGGAQEDSDCLLATGWQKVYEARAVGMVRKLTE